MLIVAILAVIVAVWSNQPNNEPKEASAKLESNPIEKPTTKIQDKK